MAPPLHRLARLALAAGIVCAAAAQAQPVPPPLRAELEDGVTVNSPRGDFRLHVGDLLQIDGRWFPGARAGGALDFALRSMRLELDGSAWGLIDFKLEPDFGGGALVVQYAYIELHFNRQVRLRAGKLKVPFGLERLQPEGRTAFLERAFPTGISPNRDVGVALLGDFLDQALIAELGVFDGAPDDSTVDAPIDGDKELAGRLFVHPLRSTGIGWLRDFGVGGAASYGRLLGSASAPQLVAVKSDGLNTFFRYRAGAAADATAIAAGERIRGAVHGYWYAGRIGLLAEYVWSSQQVRLGAARAPAVAQAAQLYVTLLLTRDRAGYGGVRPARPLRPGGGEVGTGAFELAVRYSRFWVGDRAVDDRLIDLAASARAAESYAVGLNWYLTARVKLQVDYVHTRFRGGAPGGADRPAEELVAARLQQAL